MLIHRAWSAAFPGPACFALSRGLSVLEMTRHRIAVIAAEAVIGLLLLLLLFLCRRHFMKLICACGAEVCLWIACKTAFGSESALTLVMNWVTAATVCVAVIAVVNRIDWGRLRRKPEQGPSRK